MFRKDVTKPESLDYGHMQRRTEKPELYWWPVRYTDWHGGARDRRAHSAESTQSIDRSMFIQRLVATYFEIDGREFLALEGQTVHLRQQRDTHAHDLVLAQIALNQASEMLRAFPQLSESEETRRGSAESDDSDVIVRMRRRREHRAARAITEAELGNAQSKVSLIQHEIGGLNAMIDAEFQAVRTRTLRRRQHYLRRSSVYLRALLHRHPARAAVSSAIVDPVIPIPEWTTERCPWTAPSTFSDLADNTAEHTKNEEEQ